MNIGTEYNSGIKIFKKTMNYKKINLRKNFQLMDDPAFHLNRTLKAYINNRLNKNSSTEIIDNLKNSVDLSKFNNSFNKAKTLSNIINTKKILSKNKINKLKKSNHSSKSRKKFFKSHSSNKFNISQYFHIYNNKRPNIANKINKNKILKKNSNNSQKFIRYSGSTAFSNNDTNQILDKNNNNNNSINPYNNNQILSNHSTLDINIIKSPIVGQTTSKKTKFSNQFFTKSTDYKNIHSNLTNSKINKHSNISLVKNRQNLIKYYSNNILINNNKNLDTTNKIDNNNKYFKVNNINKEKVFPTDNSSNIRNSYTFQNKSINTPKKVLDNTINISNLNKNKNISLYNNNLENNNHIENNSNTDNNNEYLKKIEMLENENKILKNEINDSKNKLSLLESKINELIMGKNSIEKVDCPKPTPYVKKYSLESKDNVTLLPLEINNNKEMENVKNKKEETYNIEIKEKKPLNKMQKNIENLSIKIKTNKSKLGQLSNSKSTFLTKEINSNDTSNKINVNKYSKNSKNIIILRKDKNKTCKKVDNVKNSEDKNKKEYKYLIKENKK